MTQGTVGRIETVESGAAARQALGRVTVKTPGPGFTEITEPVARSVAAAGIVSGLLTLFCRHTSASLTIQENADPDVRRDLTAALDRLAPRGAPYVHRAEVACVNEQPPLYRHQSEGPDDMPAHIRTMLTASSLSIPVIDCRPALGTWQGTFLIEHRDRPHTREIILHIIGG